ncbi:short-chain dehydrogenase/reductase family 16C member 6 [Sitodiplosis mosellana]|uniref:short-chain dehydrogenase/reductase family 16C member 6 n=1 Tax=Sitodiplosis mosellana TaxID=263140 RepID=UPI002443B8BD|nr:short-chain dehydrogenase/reductase family 16C member 6 [Sitodiplosis mosellana]XP_055295476.1 short-chain dehydrogenase/reductase family 16C member 6 [Sitodiplosis mosellana]XP_055295477.1 short-chain dehydrogenase/reductase family 16C member 6 [Sitodiplosis mosellana]XP_055295478.1 short-chain dehydrogenase/reductase family 16C member 6 [Sitodiplosis mosellana]XP_055295479.1 short-chain dehydrogenase/reductase family 16C member 6 [Sitodiplosis mosellana]XP_055295480.1 short-chain dehydrog
MAGENNVTLGNGNVPNTTAQPSTAKTEPGTAESILTTIVLTLWDVIVFLSISIGYIFQDLFYRVFGFPEQKLQGELALVTGGGGGLGRLISLRLSKLGVDIVIWDIKQEGIDETVEMIRANGGTCVGYKVDISKKEEVYKAADAIRRDVGDITMLINNAGVVSGRALLDTPDHLIERSFNVNVLAHFWTTKTFLPAMLEKDHGHIVTIASLAGHVGIAKLIDYCSSKFAAVGFDEALRLELELLGSQVQTTCICPFFIQSTGMFDDVNSRWVPTLTSDDVADRVVSAIQRKEKLAIIPRYLQLMLCVKWIFPWGCASGFLRRIVPDAAPAHDLLHGLPAIQRQLTKELLLEKETTADLESDKENTILSDGSNNNSLNNLNNNKSASLLIKRLPSIGERVL